MKADIHPDYHEIKVGMTDGTEYTTRATYGEPGAVLKLEIDSKSHPAWTGGEAASRARYQGLRTQRRADAEAEVAAAGTARDVLDLVEAVGEVFDLE